MVPHCSHGNDVKQRVNKAERKKKEGTEKKEFHILEDSSVKQVHGWKISSKLQNKMQSLRSVRFWWK